MRINIKNPYFWAALLLICTNGCKNETGDLLKGKWQLKTVEQAGEISPVDTVWYNFQSESIFMYQVYSAEKDRFMIQYGFKTQPGERTLQLELISNPNPMNTFLPVTDWETHIRTFTVEKVTGNKLVLAGGGKKYVFEKF
ncbi:MAG: lipocalin-like domain-containing protein [Tannerella sp.]|jgi:hypothetical protein|nr:lipocalin-like domain-containing protein [Tannerella sp.]